LNPEQTYELIALGVELVKAQNHDLIGSNT
jgi:hypothetical protein